MGKKTSKIVQFKKGKFIKNISSIKKSKELNNKYKQLQIKKRLKKSKNNSFSHNSSIKKYKKKTNHSNNNFNNINFNDNPFIFNFIFNNKNTNEKPEWMSQTTEKIENIDSRFNKEIIEYVDYIVPKNFSLFQRQNTKQRLTNIIKKYKPNWEIVLFGSFSQNTSTVFSDLDFSIISNVNSSRNMDINELIYLMKILRNEGFSRNIRLVKARVPILKATCSLTGINVDISVNRENGYKAAKIIRKILKKHKLIKPSIIILKILLKKNNLNDAHTGGMSSFLLFHLVYFFYLIYQKRIKKGIYNNIEIEQNNISENTSNNNTKDDKEYSDYENDNEESEISYDSNSEFKSNNKNKKNNDHGIIISKAVSSSDEEDNSNDDSNIIKNGNSSSNSEEERKSNDNNSSYEIGNNLIKEYEDSEDDFDNTNEDYLIKIFNKKKDKEEDEENNLNIGNFLILFFKYYSLEFNYNEVGFSLNKNNFGEIFFKLERNDMYCSDYICAESIQDQAVDVGRTCYNYPKIVNLFKNAYKKIKIEKQRNTFSILQSLGFPTI